jgi:DNA-binding PadR family transcriptional regulator
VITARVDPHVHLLPEARTAGLMRWLHRALPGVAIPADITAEGSLGDLRAAGGETFVNLLFPLREGEAEELHRYGAALAERDPGIISVAGVHVDDADPEYVLRSAIEDHGMRGLKLHPMVQRFSPGHPALAPPTASRMLDSLVARGIAERTRAKGGDRRRVEVSLTAEGRRLVAAKRARIAAAREQVFHRLSPSERRAAARLLHSLAAAIDDLHP